ncbi:MAG: GSCFA domain-containing protein, partial [Sphingomonadales bacterium]|nr:GSCFA domain-containing protein [Sphingomonadales bacterium]
MMGFAPEERLLLKWTYRGERIGHADSLLLMGSCFSERMGSQLQRHLFEVSWQPTGTIFDPVSLHDHLQAYWCRAQGQEIPWNLHDWQLLDGVWHHWNLHSKLSHPNLEQAKEQAVHAIDAGAQALQKAHTLVLTLGTAYVYFLRSSGEPVANCHRFP